MTENTATSKSKKKTAFIVIAAIIGILIIVGIVFMIHANSYVNKALKKYDNKILDGVSIENVSVAAMTKKMFRGYNNDQAVPIVVPAAWLKDHTPLQFSRYLYGEAKPKVGTRERKMIEQYYGNDYKIRNIEWVATCQEKGRSFYNVIFQPYKNQVLVAFVCIEKGQVKSIHNSWWEQDKNYPKSTTIGPDIDELLYFMPEIMVMTDTKAGFELYVSYHSLEGVHYDIWREIAGEWITIQGGYHYIMAY